MNISNLFHLSYYFGNDVFYTFNGFWVVFVILVLMIIGSFIVNAKFMKQWNFLKRTIATRLTRAGQIIGWLGLLWLFFRYESIPMFSWRIWPALLVLYFIVEVVMLIKWVKKDYPKARAKKQGMGDKDLYLRKFLGK
jgi:FlaA1/EpsC-like NDP-sugar epimerase